MSQKSNSKTESSTVSSSFLIAFCDQMAMILKSGISEAEGISILCSDASSKEDTTVLEDIRTRMETTGRMAAAVEETGRFPDYMCRMLQIGETSGNLDDVMEGLADHYRREESISRSVRNALIYPLIMSGMMLIVLLILLVKVMPVFEQVFRELGSSLSGVSLMLYNLGSWLRRYSIVLIVLIAIVAAFFVFTRVFSKGAAIRDKMAGIFPSVRRRRHLIALSRFADAMSITLRSGLMPDECLEMSAQLCEDAGFSSKLDLVKTDVSEGGDLASSLSERGVLGDLYSRMASIGSKTGNLDRVMADIARMSQETLDSELSERLALLEPVLVTILSVLVGIILLSVMFPLLSIMTSL